MKNLFKKLTLKIVELNNLHQEVMNRFSFLVDCRETREREQQNYI